MVGDNGIVAVGLQRWRRQYAHGSDGAGSIRILGSDDARKVRPRIGFLPEERGLYRRMTPVDAIAFMASLKAATDDLFYIKDPAGLLSMDRARTLVPAVKAVIGNRPLEIHAHTTVGQGMLASLEAAKLGISAIHVGVGPGGDGSSLPEANRTVANLEEAGFSVGVDKAALKRLPPVEPVYFLTEGLYLRNAQKAAEAALARLPFPMTDLAACRAIAAAPRSPSSDSIRRAHRSCSACRRSGVSHS